MCCWPKSGDGTVVKLNGRVMEDVQWACQSMNRVRLYQHRYDPAQQRYVRFEDAGDNTGWATLEMEGDVEITRPERHERKTEERFDGRRIIDGRDGSASNPYVPSLSVRAIMQADLQAGHSRSYALFIDNYGQIPGVWIVTGVDSSYADHRVTVQFSAPNDPFADETDDIYIKFRCPTAKDMGTQPIRDSSFCIEVMVLSCDPVGVDELFEYIKRHC